MPANFSGKECFVSELISKIAELWTTISDQVKALGSALAGIILVFYIFKAFTGDEQDTKVAIKNIKRVIILWIIIVFAPSLYSWLKTLIGAP